MTFNRNLDNTQGSASINCDDPRAFFVNIMSTQDYTLNNCLANYIWKAFAVRETRLGDSGDLNAYN